MNVGIRAVRITAHVANSELGAGCASAAAFRFINSAVCGVANVAFCTGDTGGTAARVSESRAIRYSAASAGLGLFAGSRYPIVRRAISVLINTRLVASVISDRAGSKGEHRTD